jgi:hypothetical protein
MLIQKAVPDLEDVVNKCYHLLPILLRHLIPPAGRHRYILVERSGSAATQDAR